MILLLRSGCRCNGWDNGFQSCAGDLWRTPVVIVSTQLLPTTFPRKRATWDRRFYLVMALAAETVLFLGFSHSYYLRFHYPASRPLSLLVQVHGLVFTSWMIYFIAQTALIAVKRPALHRRLGVFGALLGSVVIGLGLLVAVIAMRLGHGTTTQSAEVIFLVSLIDIGSFALFFILGYLKRRDREAHQRLMLLAVIVGLTGAGIGRLITFGVSVAALSLINFALLFAGPVYDLVTRRRIHPVYVWGVAFAILTFTPVRFVVGNTPWWHRMAHLLVGM